MNKPGRPALQRGALAAILVPILLGPAGVASAQPITIRGKSEQARVIARSEVPCRALESGHPGNAPAWLTAGPGRGMK
jgi:hypothetical protein